MEKSAALTPITPPRKGGVHDTRLKGEENIRRQGEIVETHQYENNSSDTTNVEVDTEEVKKE